MSKILTTAALALLVSLAFVPAVKAENSGPAVAGQFPTVQHPVSSRRPVLLAQALGKPQVKPGTSATTQRIFDTQPWPNTRR